MSWGRTEAEVGEASVTCTCCWYEDPPGSKFCGNDGQPLPVALRLPPAPAVGVRCPIPDCEYDDPATNIFCKQCGAPLKVECPRCGTTNGIDPEGVTLCAVCHKVLICALQSGVYRASAARD